MADRSKKGKRRRDTDVLEAALKVFYERGYSAATVQDVADELGILKGSLYYYIDTKEDLLFWLIELVHRDADAMLEEARGAEDLSPLERIRLYVERQVSYNLAHLKLISVYYQDMERLSADRRKVVTEQQRQNTRFVVELIKQAQQEDSVDSTHDPVLLANLVFANIIWPYRWYRSGGRIAAGTVAAVCADYAINGLTGGSLGSFPERMAA